jgi:TPR repeat protein
MAIPLIGDSALPFFAGLGSDDGVGFSEIQKNARVTLQGLQGRPELNGRIAVVVSTSPNAAGRWDVRVLPDASHPAGEDSIIRVKETNLELTKQQPPGEDALQQMDMSRRFLKQARKGGMPIMTMSGVYLDGKLYTLLPGQEPPPGIPKNFHLKQEARAEFAGRAMDLMAGLDDQKRTLLANHGESTSKLGNMRGEAAYAAFYQDIMSDESHGDWMRFFGEPGNTEHAEHTCGILGTYATVLRQRGGPSGDLDECMAVLDCEGEILEKYRRSIYELKGYLIGAGGGAHTRKAAERCYDGLEFKYQLVRFNACLGMRRNAEACTLLRKLLEYETSSGLAAEEQSMVLMLPVVLGKQATLENVKRLTEAELVTLVEVSQQVMASDPSSRERRDKVALKPCGGCGRVEKSLNDFKKCSRCQQARYCSAACQKRDWRGHKKVCKAPPPKAKQRKGKADLRAAPEEQVAEGPAPPNFEVAEQLWAKMYRRQFGYEDAEFTQDDQDRFNEICGVGAQHFHPTSMAWLAFLLVGVLDTGSEGATVENVCWLFEKSVQFGDAWGQFLFGKILVDGSSAFDEIKDTAEGMRLLKLSAAQGLPTALFTLAMFTLSGKSQTDVDVRAYLDRCHDPATVKALLRRAAEANSPTGSSDAKSMLAYFIEEKAAGFDWGTDQEAERFVREAARDGHKESIVKLAQQTMKRRS